jgi:hypothetical protein
VKLAPVNYACDVGLRLGIASEVLSLFMRPQLLIW